MGQRRACRPAGQQRQHVLCQLIATAAAALLLCSSAYAQEEPVADAAAALASAWAAAVPDEQPAAPASAWAAVVPDEQPAVAATVVGPEPAAVPLAGGPRAPVARLQLVAPAATSNCSYLTTADAPHQILRRCMKTTASATSGLAQGWSADSAGTANGNILTAALLARLDYAFNTNLSAFSASVQRLGGAAPVELTAKVPLGLLSALDAAQQVYYDTARVRVTYTEQDVFVLLAPSEKINDWISNFRALPGRANLTDDLDVCVHQGFYAKYRAIRPQLWAHLTNVTRLLRARTGVTPPVHFMGWSQGAAVALLAAANAHAGPGQRFTVGSVIGFGPPSPGCVVQLSGYKYTDFFSLFVSIGLHNRTFLVANSADIVASLPPDTPAPGDACLPASARLGACLRFPGRSGLLTAGLAAPARRAGRKFVVCSDRMLVNASSPGPFPSCGSAEVLLDNFTLLNALGVRGGAAFHAIDAYHLGLRRLVLGEGGSAPAVFGTAGAAQQVATSTFTALGAAGTLGSTPHCLKDSHCQSGCGTFTPDGACGADAFTGTPAYYCRRATDDAVMADQQCRRAGVPWAAGPPLPSTLRIVPAAEACASGRVFTTSAGAIILGSRTILAPGLLAFTTAPSTAVPESRRLVDLSLSLDSKLRLGGLLGLCLQGSATVSMQLTAALCVPGQAMQQFSLVCKAPAQVPLISLGSQSVASACRLFPKAAQNLAAVPDSQGNVKMQQAATAASNGYVWQLCTVVL